MHNVELTGPRIACREMRVSDAEVLLELMSIPEVFKYTSDQEIPPLEAIRDFLTGVVADIENPERDKYKLALTVDGRLVGTGGVDVTSTPNRTGELGYMLHPDFWGRGLGTEAATLLVGFGFDDLKLHRLEATAAPDNIGSRRILEKIGMQFEGTRRDAMNQRGTWRDSVAYAILATDPRPSVS